MAGGFQGKLIFTKSPSTAGRDQGQLRYSSNPTCTPMACFLYSVLWVSRARCKGKAVVYTTTSLTWFQNILGSYQHFI